jgi:glycosyltransferase involved in cell wall biosynthesis
MSGHNDHPFFSILTVCLNAGPLLAETINSVVDQTCPDFEVIIKDGGSTDGSLNFLSSDNQIQLIIKPDHGIYDAMNQALKMAKGEYILFLNAGDSFVSKDVLQKILAFSTGKKPSLIYTDYLKGPGKTLIRNPAHLTSSYLMRTMICHQSCFFRKECYDQSGDFNLNYQVAADYDFLVRVIHKNKGSHLHYPYPAIQYQGGGYSINNMSRSLREVIEIRKKNFSSLRLFFFYSWYLFTFPKIRQQIIEKYNPNFYFQFSNFIRSGGRKR